MMVKSIAKSEKHKSFNVLWTVSAYEKHRVSLRNIAADLLTAKGDRHGESACVAAHELVEGVESGFFLEFSHLPSRRGTVGIEQQ
jgi:hypothetical protein